MNWHDLQHAFDRALRFSIDKRKVLLAFLVLAAGGLLVVFGRAVALHTGSLFAVSMGFMPLFLAAALLLSGGILLVRIYHDNVKKKAVSYQEVFGRSWELMAGAFYFSLPFILGYLLLWMLLGLFYLMKELPLIGDFFAVVLVFGPFLINVASILLVVLNVAMLFFLTPIIALRGINRMQISQNLSKRFRADTFSHLVLFFIGLAPVALTLGILHLAFYLTGCIGFMACGVQLTQVQSFFVMLPYVACLAPSVVLFFNFATEAHLLMKQER